MIYLYAITDRSEAPLPIEMGLDGSPPFKVPHRGITAIVSPFTKSQVPATEVNLWAHEAVVEALMADRAVLPLRFGTVLSSRAAVEGALEDHYCDFTASLERVRGLVELGLRVLWEDNVDREHKCDPSSVISRSSASGSGRAYLLTRLEQERRTLASRRRAEALAAEIDMLLGRLTVEHTHQVLFTHRLLLTAAYLVKREQMAAFKCQVEALSVTYPALSFLCTGPWPPYSFVSTTLPTEERANVDAQS